jgi:hypothetical protein
MHEQHPSPRLRKTDTSNDKTKTLTIHASPAHDIGQSNNQGGTNPMAQANGKLVGIALRLVAGAAVILTCVRAHATPDLKERVYRAQLLVSVCDRQDAHTDDWVYASLRPELSNACPHGGMPCPLVGCVGPCWNVTWLNYGRNDFERDDTFTYDLGLHEIYQFSDVKHLMLAKTGGNDVCIDRVALLLNERKLFEREFGGGKWINGTTGFIDITQKELHQSATWLADTTPSPLNGAEIDRRMIYELEIESMIEAAVGSAIHGKSLYWRKRGGKYVNVARKDEHSVVVDLDLADDRAGQDPDVDVNFDIRFCDCDAEERAVSLRNVKATVDQSNWTEWMNLGIRDDVVKQVMEANIRGLSLTSAGGSSNNSSGINANFCPLVKIIDGGSFRVGI